MLEEQSPLAHFMQTRLNDELDQPRTSDSEELLTSTSVHAHAGEVSAGWERKPCGGEY